MQAIQGVSEIGGHELRTCYLDRKEETSYKHLSYGALFSRYDHFKYQNMRKTALLLAVKGGHFEYLL